ncbi:NAD(P)-dependent dehydrogenase (short-subunit alcohol dehydrogenase family) [Streptomyces sp. 846.5]|nr:SDR family oxidoreductase [Streptomyces sp. 846.5]TDT98293.1 NAD(P)-dependent dehydrogenase (short-subunit alcohol dehydrogenase family) [Streptomyces sp. 846.5]
MDSQLQGRRILVTGAAGGIGAAAVRVFAEAGATVAATYRNSPPPDSLDTEATWLQCDLRSPEQADKAVAAAAEALGGLDVVLHAAGTWGPGPAGEITEENLDFMLDTNVKATVFINQAAYRVMRDAGQGGRIINLGSGEAVTGITWSSSYALAKGAVHAWTRSAAKAWGRYGITVNAVAPAVETPGAERFREFLGPEAAAMIRKSTSQTRPIAGSFGAEELGDPVRDLGPVLVFLAGPGSHFVTGQLLAVGGGSMMLGA